MLPRESAQTIFHDEPPPAPSVRVVTISTQPLKVRWTGPPVWVELHWLKDVGRKGRSLPCEGRDCRIHTTPTNWRVYAPAIDLEPRPNAQQRCDGTPLDRFHVLPDAEQERLIAMAKLRNSKVKDLHTLIRIAGDLLDAERPAAAATLAQIGTPLIVDMPRGCGAYLARQFGGRDHWRGQGCHLRRPRGDRGLPTIVNLLQPASADEMPPPPSVKATLCQLWGYQTEEAAEAAEDDRSVLAFRRQFA